MRQHPVVAREWRADVVDAAVVALLSFLPFARGLLTGQSLYLRDLSRYFFPLRRFAVEGLLAGHLRYWNPFVHEGESLSIPPVSYPFDLLQALLPDERGFSLLLALHVPLAAVAFLRLARALGVARAPACGGALVYALGGFALSSLNLYFFIQALAWAPLVVLGLWRAAQGDRRDVAVSALLTGIALSTTAVEIVAQAVLVGLVLSPEVRSRARWMRQGAALALAAGLAAATLLFVRDLVAGSERAVGFSTDVVLSYSVHPVSLFQVVIGGLHGDLHDLVNHFWGARWLGRFPYIASLYLGAAVLALAVVGARFGPAMRRRLVVLILLALVVCLGRTVGLGLLVEALPVLRMFRFPVKAFYTVHLAVALLVAFGLHALAERSDTRAWRALLASGAALGGLLVAVPALVPLFLRAWPGASSRFFPEGYPPLFQAAALSRIVADAAVGGLVAVAMAVLSWLYLRGRLKVTVAVRAAVALVVADLLRTGAGLNPTVSQWFYELSPQMTRIAQELRTREARVFTCEPEFSPSFQPAAQVASRRMNGHEIWSIAVYQESLTPLHNIRERVRTAYSRDLTAVSATERTLSDDEIGCASFASIAPRLREAGVTHVVSLSPLDDPDLELIEAIAPRRILPVTLHLYGLRSANSLRELVPPEAGRVASAVDEPGAIDVAVEADRPATLVVREAFDPGWSATVDGRAAPLERANGRHLGVSIGAGRHRVELRYGPRHRGLGLATSGSCAVIVALLLARAPRRRVESEDQRGG